MEHIKVIVAGPARSGKTSTIYTASQKTQTSPSLDGGQTDAQGALPSPHSGSDIGETVIGGNKITLHAAPDLSDLAGSYQDLLQGAAGLILLVDNTRPNPFVDLFDHLDAFKTLIAETELAIGVTKTDLQKKPTIADYHLQLQTFGLKPPVFSVDARNPQDVGLLLQSLLLSLDPQQGF